MTEARVPVTVEDREAAIRHLERTGRSREDLCGASIRSGDWDHTEDVQAFARHRLAGVAAGREEAQAEIVRLRGLLEEALQVCGDYADDYMGTMDEVRIRGQIAAIRQRGV